MTSLALTHVCHQYDSQLALEDISLSTVKGEILGLIGANGSGKSTLLKIMSGVLSPIAGSVLLADRPIGEWNRQAMAQRVAMVSANEMFAFPFTVSQIVHMGRLPHLAWWQRESDRDRRVAEQAMAETDVLSLRDRSIQQLSSGERQRVLLARALAQEPEILLLDEPSAHLDIGHEWVLFELLQQLAKGGLSIVCAIHNLTLAARFAQRLVLLHAGRIVANDVPQNVLDEKFIAVSFGVAAQVLWAGPQNRELLLIPSKG